MKKLAVLYSNQLAIIIINLFKVDDKRNLQVVNLLQ